jgi:hypothetical protein
MGFQYKIDKDKRLVETSGGGVFTKDHAIAHQQQLLADPDFEPSFYQLMDLTHVTAFEVSDADIRYLAERSVFSAESRRAIVVKTDEGYGLARMFGIIRELRGEWGIRVFRNHDDAWEWLYPKE